MKAVERLIDSGIAAGGWSPARVVPPGVAVTVIFTVVAVPVTALPVKSS